ncbi:MAG: DUF4245 family protein [Arachnia sp.]
MARNPNTRPRDMFISMAVIVVPVLLLVWFFSSPGEQKPERVDVSAQLTRATEESAYPLLVADGLGDGWTPVRASWAKEGQPWITGDPAEADSWQVGYLSPDEVYFGVQQRDGAEVAFVRSATREGHAVGGEVQAAGRSWQRYESKDGRTRSLVSEAEADTAVVAADADFLALEAFAATLTEVASQG